MNYYLFFVNFFLSYDVYSNVNLCSYSINVDDDDGAGLTLVRDLHGA